MVYNSGKIKQFIFYKNDVVQKVSQEALTKIVTVTLHMYW
ncbi:hypothetical protein SAMN05421545_0345 [Pontibacter lucknowensis]|uniref:Uncharacterized protein n=1 Tax=Pontibacter lucknowensis TaxID=1077936 RepID=A0A1N6TI09_9BACT|nr:hypothetical protein SAMN05421545_0345 [Pontibacter lucknowensis]